MAPQAFDWITSLHLPPGAPLLAATKLMHECTVGLSLLGFVARAAGAVAGAGWVRHRLTRRLPHVNDTVLLASAVTLATLLHLNPLTTPWLAAKLLGLVAYIALGMLALSAKRSPTQRAVAALAALLVFANIVVTARGHNAYGLLSLWQP